MDITETAIVLKSEKTLNYETRTYLNKDGTVSARLTFKNGDLMRLVVVSPASGESAEAWNEYTVSKI